MKLGQSQLVSKDYRIQKGHRDQFSKQESFATDDNQDLKSQGLSRRLTRKKTRKSIVSSKSSTISPERQRTRKSQNDMAYSSKVTVKSSFAKQLHNRLLSKNHNSENDEREYVSPLKKSKKNKIQNSSVIEKFIQKKQEEIQFKIAEQERQIASSKFAHILAQRRLGNQVSLSVVEDPRYRQRLINHNIRKFLREVEKENKQREETKIKEESDLMNDQDKNNKTLTNDKQYLHSLNEVKQINKTIQIEEEQREKYNISQGEKQRSKSIIFKENEQEKRGNLSLPGKSNKSYARIKSQIESQDKGIQKIMNRLKSTNLENHQFEINEEGTKIQEMQIDPSDFKIENSLIEKTKKKSTKKKKISKINKSQKNQGEVGNQDRSTFHVPILQISNLDDMPSQNNKTKVLLNTSQSQFLQKQGTKIMKRKEYQQPQIKIEIEKWDQQKLKKPEITFSNSRNNIPTFVEGLNSLGKQNTKIRFMHSETKGGIDESFDFDQESARKQLLSTNDLMPQKSLKKKGTRNMKLDLSAAKSELKKGPTKLQFVDSFRERSSDEDLANESEIKSMKDLLKFQKKKTQLALKQAFSNKMKPQRLNTKLSHQQTVESQKVSFQNTMRSKGLVDVNTEEEKTGTDANTNTFRPQNTFNSVNKDVQELKFAAKGDNVVMNKFSGFFKLLINKISSDGAANFIKQQTKAKGENEYQFRVISPEKEEKLIPTIKVQLSNIEDSQPSTSIREPLKPAQERQYFVFPGQNQIKTPQKNNSPLPSALKSSKNLTQFFPSPIESTQNLNVSQNLALSNSQSLKKKVSFQQALQVPQNQLAAQSLLHNKVNDWKEKILAPNSSIIDLESITIDKNQESTEKQIAIRGFENSFSSPSPDLKSSLQKKNVKETLAFQTDFTLKYGSQNQQETVQKQPTNGIRRLQELNQKQLAFQSKQGNGFQNNLIFNRNKASNEEADSRMSSHQLQSKSKQDSTSNDQHTYISAEGHFRKDLNQNILKSEKQRAEQNDKTIDQRCDFKFVNLSKLKEFNEDKKKLLPKLQVSASNFDFKEQVQKQVRSQSVDDQASIQLQIQMEDPKENTSAMKNHESQIFSTSFISTNLRDIFSGQDGRDSRQLEQRSVFNLNIMAKRNQQNLNEKIQKMLQKDKVQPSSEVSPEKSNNRWALEKLVASQHIEKKNMNSLQISNPKAMENLIPKNLQKSTALKPIKDRAYSPEKIEDLSLLNSSGEDFFIDESQSKKGSQSNSKIENLHKLSKGQFSGAKLASNNVSTASSVIKLKPPRHSKSKSLGGNNNQQPCAEGQQIKTILPHIIASPKHIILKKVTNNVQKSNDTTQQVVSTETSFIRPYTIRGQCKNQQLDSSRIHDQNGISQNYRFFDEDIINSSSMFKIEPLPVNSVEIIDQSQKSLGNVSTSQISSNNQGLSFTMLTRGKQRNQSLNEEIRSKILKTEQLSDPRQRQSVKNRNRNALGKLLNNNHKSSTSFQGKRITEL